MQQLLAGGPGVVAALGGRDPQAVTIEVPANARVESFVPFDRLPPHADVLVTNGERRHRPGRLLDQP
ncbi:hypothetical protein [Streptomyces himastatinicus]|uniref:hypothetical protein n=1 Tax=Streptomyces himastatinicus TaxID=998084 RepID=UPI0001B4ED0F|nr:hypothetical protein [Streptomyces himastatinicus]